MQRAKPDGYTLILGHVGTLAVNPSMFAKLPYDLDKDFVPITLLAPVPTLLVVNPSVPAKNLKEFVALAKAKPGDAVLRFGRQRKLGPSRDGISEAGRAHRPHPRALQGNRPAWSPTCSAARRTRRPPARRR